MHNVECRLYVLRGQLETRKLRSIRAEPVLDFALQDEATPNEKQRRGLPELKFGASQAELRRDEHRDLLTFLLGEFNSALKPL